MSTIDDAIARANGDRYLTKAQARALAAEVVRLREQLEEWDAREWQGRAAERFLTVLDRRSEPDRFPERLIHCDLCGATAWQPVILLAASA